MDVAQVRALATELETTLGLLSDLVLELQTQRNQWAHAGPVHQLVTRLASRPSLGRLPTAILRAHGEINYILEGIRSTRSALQVRAVERIRDTHNRLIDVTSTTENATIELMNGLDRTIELVNSLEQQAAGNGSSDGYQLLRDQVSALYNHLQFQDITTQQLQGVTHSLTDLEQRVGALSAIFDQGMVAEPPGSALRQTLEADSSSQLAFNPDATMKRTVADQSMVDETFKGARNGHPHPASRSPGL
jgi:chemotaxis regulatin CheY-phosphate phosphatase CheZ